jgi:hypothetical protein
MRLQWRKIGNCKATLRWFPLPENSPLRLLLSFVVLIGTCVGAAFGWSIGAIKLEKQ